MNWITTFSDRKLFKILPWLLIVLLLWFNGCKSEKQVAQSITVPEVKGTFEAVKPTPITPEKKTVYVTRWKEKEVVTVNPIDTVLSNNYLKATDSIKRLQMYVDAIQLHDYETKFDNNDLTLIVKSKVRGDLLEIKPDYTIKERKVEVQCKEVTFRLLAGAEVGTNKELKANIMIQNKKGNIISVSRDLKNNYFIGYNFSIFTIKK